MSITSTTQHVIFAMDILTDQREVDSIKHDI